MKKRSGINITNLIRCSVWNEEVLQMNGIQILNKSKHGIANGKWRKITKMKVKLSSPLIKRKWSDIMVNCRLSLCHSLVIYKWKEKTRTNTTRIRVFIMLYYIPFWTVIFLIFWYVDNVKRTPKENYKWNKKKKNKIPLLTNKWSTIANGQGQSIHITMVGYSKL